MGGMFCPSCKSIMFPKDGKLVCRKCGEEKEAGSKVVTQDMHVSDKAEYADTPEDTSILPTTRIECPKCKNKKAGWYMRQTRAADEPTTRFYICTKCQHTWREY